MIVVMFSRPPDSKTRKPQDALHKVDCGHCATRVPQDSLQALAHERAASRAEQAASTRYPCDADLRRHSGLSICQRQCIVHGGAPRPIANSSGDASKPAIRHLPRFILPEPLALAVRLSASILDLGSFRTSCSKRSSEQHCQL